MWKSMRILIAYDGSPCAQAALSDLSRAGFPSNAEALVLTVADTWPLPEGQAELTRAPSTTMRAAREAAALMQARAQNFAREGAERVKALFPTWHVQAEAVTDSPAWAIILKAETWRADLIVVGSHGYSSLGRWLLGSVSQTVLTHATTSVRIARERPTPPDRPLRVLIGVDGSLESDQAVRTAAARHWPTGTDVRLILVLNPAILATVGTSLAVTTAEYAAVTANGTQGQPLADQEEADEIDGLIGRMLDSYAAIISCNSAAVTVSTALLPGEPKLVLVEEAEKWGADCIFIGSRGLSRWERLLLGSVSSAVAARAHCTVEVVRATYTRKG
jgi:nucleotide-binding universal stress UspA family protein